MDTYTWEKVFLYMAKWYFWSYYMMTFTLQCVWEKVTPQMHLRNKGSMSFHLSETLEETRRVDWMWSQKQKKQSWNSHSIIIVSGQPDFPLPLRRIQRLAERKDKSIVALKLLDHKTECQIKRGTLCWTYPFFDQCPMKTS